MSELTKLLEGVKVEWKTLGEISELYGGLKGKSKNDFTDGNAKYVTYKNIFNNIEINFDTLETVKVSPNENQYEIRYGDVLFTGSSEIASEAGMSSSVTKSSDTKIYLNSFSFGLRFNQNVELIPEFTKYLFRSKYMRDAIAKTASGVTRYNISKKRFIRLQIPIPCPDNPEKSLKIQQEIVRILDRLSEETNQLTAALQKELQLHQKRYDFYREELFKFEGKEVEWKALVELAEIGTGSRNTNQAVVDGKYPFFVRSQIPRRINEFEFDETAIITAGDGVGVGKVFHFVNEKYALHQRAYRIVIKNNKLSPKFLFYYIKNNFSKYVEKNSVYASVTSLRKPMFEKYPVPVPSLKEQERIIQIIDEFDLTTNFVIKEIQKEITLRNKQYEYYRDHLLSFQSLHAEAEAIQ